MEGQAPHGSHDLCVAGFANKFGSALSSFLCGLLLTVSGFVEGAEVQSASALTMIRFMQSFIPTIFGILCAVCLCAYGIEKIRPQMNAELVVKRAARAEALAAAEN